MKKFAAGLLTALCATAIATAQPADQATEYTQQPVSTQAAPAQTAAPQAVATEAQANAAMPIDEQPAPTLKKKNPISIGAKASFIYGYFWGFKELKEDDLDSPSGFGGEFGIAASFNMIEGLQFSPEIAFRIFNLSHDDEDFERCYNQMFLDFAFYMRGSITSKFFLEVGPQLSINTSGDYPIDGNSNFDKIEQSPVEFGLNIGAGYNILDNLSVGFRWYMGFNEVFPDVKYKYDIDPKDYDKESGEVKGNIKWSTIHLNGAHTMMFKFGVTYWFN